MMGCKACIIPAFLENGYITERLRAVAFMRMFFIGDVVGKPGRHLVRTILPEFRREEAIDFVVANGENAAGGKGLTGAVAKELFDAGVDVLTGGNHSWKNRDIFQVIDEEPRLLRPANYPVHEKTPGKGHGVFNTASDHMRVGVINIMGRVFLDNLDCPFRAAEALVEQIRKSTPLILVDFHAEATSEKVAMAWHLDGKVTAVIGTHTHIPTADERVTNAGTAAQTDAGMTGAYDGVLGIRKDIILHNMITRLPVRHELAKGDPRLCGLLVDADPDTGQALAARRIMLQGLS